MLNLRFQNKDTFHILASSSSAFLVWGKTFSYTLDGIFGCHMKPQKLNNTWKCQVLSTWRHVIRNLGEPYRQRFRQDRQDHWGASRSKFGSELATCCLPLSKNESNIVPCPYQMLCSWFRIQNEMYPSIKLCSFIDIIWNMIEPSYGRLEDGLPKQSWHHLMVVSFSLVTSWGYLWAKACFNASSWCHIQTRCINV